MTHWQCAPLSDRRVLVEVVIDTTRLDAKGAINNKTKVEREREREREATAHLLILEKECTQRSVPSLFVINKKENRL